MSTPLVHLSMITFYHKLMFIYLSEKWWRCYFQSLVDQCLFDEKAAFFGYLLMRVNVLIQYVLDIKMRRELPEIWRMNK